MKRKGAPKKLHKKSPLELLQNKAKACFAFIATSYVLFLVPIGHKLGDITGKFEFKQRKETKGTSN